MTVIGDKELCIQITQHDSSSAVQARLQQHIGKLTEKLSDAKATCLQLFEWEQSLYLFITFRSQGGPMKAEKLLKKDETLTAIASPGIFEILQWTEVIPSEKQLRYESTIGV